ncbi:MULTISPECIES: hypothetical protein [unclassified Saccharicrinis]|uniref:hypothetical protein n=1 Tax=unclassified Saccharicrinis TaxID=2646859 RepID=UPI003D34789C
MENKNIDELLSNTYKEFEEPQIPLGFIDKLTRKFELRNMRRRLWEEWLFKMLVVLAILAGLVGAFIYLGEDLTMYFSYQYILPLLGILMLAFVFFFNDVVLKWMFFTKKMKK